ncbi:MAG: polysaccharide biosynthesis protein, partial [Verrucomicrobiota bacterium]|nr:polysaccharide biosynthesis protein [Verrucomicrobiota bacterium]
KTQFMAVRFGNVLGSSGSVIPIFRRQIKLGGPLTVTDPEVTRFFMTLKESVGLVLQSATQGSGGEIFVLDMGESLKIVDIARQMIVLSGLKEGRDIDIEFIGLRAGEKVFEEVQHLSEVLQTTSHPRIRRFIGSPPKKTFVQELLDELRPLFESNDSEEIKRRIQKWIPEYQPALVDSEE